MSSTPETLIINQVDNLKLLITYAPVAMCIFNGSNFVVGVANEKALELWGKRITDVINKPLFECFPELKDQGLKEILDSVFKTGERFIANVRPVSLPRDNQMQTFYINFLYEPVKDEDGKVRAIIGVARDVTSMVLDHEKEELEKEKIKKQMLRASIDAQEKERQLISTELHDNVCQILATTKLLSETIEGNNEKEKNTIEQLRINIESAITEIRKVSHGLNPLLLDFVGLASAVADIADKINLSEKIKVHFECLRNSNTESVDKQIELALFRIIQTQVVNILTHSNCTEAAIILAYETDFIELSIIDNGRGFETAHTKQGLGFQNIKNRAQLFNGTLHITSFPGEGCKLNVRIPLENEHYN